jgi:uncharacterized protein YbjQ (UPF0145 family)
MLWTTTPSIENRVVTAYRGIVVAEIALAGGSLGTSVEIIDGINLDLSLQTARFEEARSKALRSLEVQAKVLGADAIVGLRFEYVTFGKNGILNMVSAYGTAICIKLSAEEQKIHLLAELRGKADFWVSIDGKERGPFSIEQLSQLVAEGKISPETAVRSEESGQSTSLSSLLSR